MTGVPQLRRACNQGRVGAEPLRVRNRTDHPVLRPYPAVPVAFDPHLLAVVADDLDQNALQQQPDDALALLLGRRVRPPQRGKILGQGADRGEFRRAYRRRLLAQNPVVLGREPALLGQRLFPRALERARHQPVLGLACIVLAARAARSVW
jgi:hypothetical protein